MPDPVVLYIRDDNNPSYGLHVREATAAEVLSHPAVAALVAERDRLREALEDVRAIAADRERFVLLGPRSFAQALSIIDAATRAAKETP